MAQRKRSKGRSGSDGDGLYMLLFLVLMFLVFGPESCRQEAMDLIESQLPASQTQAVISSVVDGDTIKTADGKTVRIIGIDTPETKHPTKPVECYGPEASAKATELLAGQTVTLVTDKVAGATDRYGRTLAHVTLPDGSSYGQQMITEGYAKHYPYQDQKHRFYIPYETAQTSAKLQKVGMWGAC